ncbi:MAG: DUF1476 domain-containing protein [Alphaproteobacteria bacterium]|nr:DUF1476 domain-containing protein [Alphaproteobacteria bacterium]
MSSFDQREKAFEKKYEHDQMFAFKVNARRNKLLGLWAAAQLGLGGSEADAYAKQVVQADFTKPGDDDVLAKVLGDLQGKGLDVSEHRVRRQMNELLSVAKEQVASE